MFIQGESFIVGQAMCRILLSIIFDLSILCGLGLYFFYFVEIGPLFFIGTLATHQLPISLLHSHEAL